MRRRLSLHPRAAAPRRRDQPPRLLLVIAMAVWLGLWGNVEPATVLSGALVAAVVTRLAAASPERPEHRPPGATGLPPDH